VEYYNANFSWIYAVHRFKIVVQPHATFAGESDFALFNMPSPAGPGACAPRIRSGRTR
jgi:hypothetical protein